ncbi:MAG: tRNA (adenosine(37)-N6)-threonylcarbamoyltransferase complex ATPase subunit type 1 TsaE [Candidatus Sungiibacteriota bacterium]|uniref:tRNA threonylcarbamoyladenosine biosynthesis protein TsaE n=1 Tax=Candidatus Sungiibacteriota bacterium TaxID=2750080 RepID=A0A7T5RIT3_9BACT|nr:MAG: tRNA (adenosine(37)-N6)-threonylcarbamoyltransferase complex ATPase subunit type 1 TsaE [Candidatus Sungbacteria bacterium]
MSKSPAQTKKIARFVLDRVKKQDIAGPRVMALEGNLGSGKTTFVQGLSSTLGIKERILSPTFVLIKIYQTAHRRFKHLIHIDCYRLRSSKDLLHLGFKDLLCDQDAIIVIEWADRIKKLIPHGALWIKFKHGKNPAERIIKIKK